MSVEVVSKNSKLWKYLNEEIKGLILDGENLLVNCHTISGQISDYSYLVFPFAKAYEGFLKVFFLDLGLIREDEFYGDHLRIGRILNPYFTEKDYSVYAKLDKYNKKETGIAKRLWEIWTRGRNKVFHYFPHNFRKLTRVEAAEIIDEFVKSMESAVSLLDEK